MSLSQDFITKHKLKKNKSGSFNKQRIENIWFKCATQENGILPGVAAADSCCGVHEIRGASSPDALEAGVIIALRRDGQMGRISKHRAIIYYSVSPDITKRAEEIGFKNCGSFKNPGSRNTITVLLLFPTE